jgi:uncharacterized protein (TIGR00299 family) protein
MRVAYLDCASGISGDMMLGALVDVGVPLAAIQQGLDSLGLPTCQLVAREVTKKGFRATHIEVQHEPEHQHRHLHHITEMIDGSTLSDRQKDLAKRIFCHLGAAEARVHGTSIEKVHFHEVGAVDSIADIVGSAIGWDLLGADRLECSPIPTGQGHVTIAHGRVSIPAPATAELLKGVPLAPSVVEAELTTPTGAAIVTTIAQRFGHLPPMRVESIGYGAGSRDLDQQPNLVRLMVGDSEQLPTTPDYVQQDVVWILETNMDDVRGEWVAHCTNKLLSAGARDVFTTPIQMKKNRPGVTLSVLCDVAEIRHLEEIIFQETGALGIRRWQTERHKLARRAHSVTTEWGVVLGKLARLPNGDLSFTPEYESCRDLAAQSGRRLGDVYRAAERAFDASAEQINW